MRFDEILTFPVAFLVSFFWYVGATQIAFLSTTLLLIGIRFWEWSAKIWLVTFSPGIFLVSLVVYAVLLMACGINFFPR